MNNRGYVSRQQGRSPGPNELGWVTIGLGALVILHLLVPIALILARDTIAAGVERANPALAPDVVEMIVISTLVASTLFHVLFVGLYIWFGLKLRAGRRWARIALTVTLLTATVASAVSFSSSPLFRLIIPVSDLLQLALVALLWLPHSMREYFATDGDSLD